MATHLGPLRVEITEPESAKFTAALVLVHGLWAHAAGWRPFAGYLAHRGWRCFAVQMEAASAGTDLAARARALRAAIAALDAPPVVVGHDLGAITALQCADATRAVVALAPLVGKPFADPSPALRRAGNWWTRWNGSPLSAPRGRWQSTYPPLGIREPSATVRPLVDGSLAAAPLPPDVPGALFTGDGDPLLDVTQARAFAEHLGAELHILPGAGHAVLEPPNWQPRIAAIHRWIIQRLGVDLLALYDEAWEGREKP